MDGKRIVLGQENGSFHFEIQHFNYSTCREQQLNYYASTACRFFPLARNGDTFTKTKLHPKLQDYVWSVLQQQALANAEVVSIDGHDYPVDTHAYFPIGLSQRRYHARTGTYGITLTVEAVRPAVFAPDWEGEELGMQILLVWRKPDRTLALAPWRLAHRKYIAEAINAGRLNDIYSRGMPVARLRDDNEDDGWDGLPPFQPDPDLPPGTVTAIDTITAPDPFSLLCEAQFAVLMEQTPQTTA